MTCVKCVNKGYIEHRYLLNGTEKSKISQCTECRDITKYSAEIKKRYGGLEETQQQKINRLTARDQDA